MSVFVALFLGAVQGFAELFPLSSLGILVILPHALPLSFNVSGARYLPFVTALHAATALALLVYFWRDWVRLVTGWLKSLAGQENPDGSLFWLLIIGSIPAGIAGILLKHQIARLFDAPLTAALLLVVNGCILLTANMMVRRRQEQSRPLEQLTVGAALLVGVFQMFALLPGLSRSGLAMTGGLRTGLNLENAARFAFLLATPIIGAASLVEVPKLAHHHGPSLLGPAIVGGLAAGIVAWFSTRYLLRYFENGNLRGLAFLSLALGVIGLIIVR